MSKKQQPRRLDETEAAAYAHALRTSAQKLNIVAQSIRGMPASAARAAWVNDNAAALEIA